MASITTLTSLSINQTESTQTIAFLPGDNNEIIFSLPIKSPFQTFSFSFRTYSNLSILIQFEEINFNIDSGGYLTIVNQNEQAKRILSNKEQRPINNGQTYYVQLEFKNKTLSTWIDKNMKVSIEYSSSSLLVENFIFGLHNQFIGCIENVTYNNWTFSFENISLHRQRCFLSNYTIKSVNNIYINQIVSFKEYDHPLIINLNQSEEFHSFSFVFYTQESNGIICSLSDKTYENFIILSIHYERLFLTYNNHKQDNQIQISANKSVNDINEHKIIIKCINENYLVLKVDESVIIENITCIFYISSVSIGGLDSFIKEKFSSFDRDNFIGCIKDVMLNKKLLIKFKHINQANRLASTCQATKRDGK